MRQESHEMKTEKTKHLRFFSINREQQQIKRDAMEAQHSDTFSSKRTWEPTLGKGRNRAQSAQLRSGTSPVLEAGDSSTPAPAHTAGTSIVLLYSKCWQREGGRGWTWRSTEDNLKKYLKIHNSGHCQGVMDIEPGKNRQRFLLKNAKLSRVSISRWGFFL